jgi:hypothetical protein
VENGFAATTAVSATPVSATSAPAVIFVAFMGMYPPVVAGFRIVDF